MSSVPAAEETEGDGLVHALSVLRDRWLIVVLTTVVVTALVLAYSLAQTKVYESTAQVQFANSQVTDSVLDIQRGSAQPERDAATQVLVATSPDVAELVRRQLRAPAGTADELLEAVTVESADNANVISITAKDEDPARAAAIANAFARQYIAFNRGSDVQQLDASARALELQLRGLAQGAPERASIEQELARIQAARGATSGLRVIGTAAVASSPASPMPRRDAAIGLVLGLVLGLALVFVLDLFDRRVKTVEGFEAAYGSRALASIPQSSFSEGGLQPGDVAFEPFRVLRNAIGFAELDQDFRVIMVTSAMPSEGKSSVSLNLARAIALSGQRVVLVECDLRKPSLADRLGLERSGGGLTTALVGRRPVEELLEPVTASLRHLTVLLSGPLPPNAAELLRSPRMGTVLNDLLATGARVIIDAPPLLPVADAQGLLDHPQVDAALIVARAYQTTRDEARRARAVIAGHRLQPLGLVVTGVTEEKQYGYYGEGQAGAPDFRPAEPAEPADGASRLLRR